MAVLAFDFLLQLWNDTQRSVKVSKPRVLELNVCYVAFTHGLFACLCFLEMKTIDFQIVSHQTHGKGRYKRGQCDTRRHERILPVH